MSKAKEILIAAAFTLVAAGCAFGVETVNEAPVAESYVPWAAVAYAIIGVAGICAIGFKKSRRVAMG